MAAVNTHELYGTVGHRHLDGLAHWATGEYPGSALSLIECSDGRWFVEVDFGGAFDRIDGVSRPAVEPWREPAFFASEHGAREFAVRCIKAVHPGLADRDDLLGWFEERA